MTTIIVMIKMVMILMKIVNLKGLKGKVRKLLVIIIIKRIIIARKLKAKEKNVITKIRKKIMIK